MHFGQYQGNQYFHVVKFFKLLITLARLGTRTNFSSMTADNDKPCMVRVLHTSYMYSFKIYSISFKTVTVYLVISC